GAPTPAPTAPEEDSPPRESRRRERTTQARPPAVQPARAPRRSVTKARVWEAARAIALAAADPSAALRGATEGRSRGVRRSTHRPRKPRTLLRRSNQPLRRASHVGDNPR